MEAVDLLCSRNAHYQNVLVRRAQQKINQPPSLREREQASLDGAFILLTRALAVCGKARFIHNTP